MLDIDTKSKVIEWLTNFSSSKSPTHTHTHTNFSLFCCRSSSLFLDVIQQQIPKKKRNKFKACETKLITTKVDHWIELLNSKYCILKEFNVLLNTKKIDKIFYFISWEDDKNCLYVSYNIILHWPIQFPCTLF